MIIGCEETHVCAGDFIEFETQSTTFSLLEGQGSVITINRLVMKYILPGV